MASVPPDPGPWLERLDEIRDTGDRRATLDLTALLCDPGARLDEESLDDIAETLCALEDLRCRPALERVMLNRTASRDVRLAALRVLGCLPFNDPPHATVLEYARDPDDIVRAYGASFLEPVDEERLAAAIGDPAVLVRRAAAESLVASARTPRLVAALRAGLRDSDALVREIATRAALFDEPLAATYDLLHLLDDVDTDVRCSVYDALEDFPSVSVMLALADARSGPEGPLAEAALDLLLTRVRATLEGAANESGAPPERLRRWAAPVRGLLD